MKKEEMKLESRDLDSYGERFYKIMTTRSRQIRQIGNEIR